MSETVNILYCHCAHARVVPAETKTAVLSNLASTGQKFEAVSDLCEMSARKDPRLESLCAQDGLRIAACYPRAVRWLLSASGNKLPDDAVVANMRTETPDSVLRTLETGEVPVPEISESKDSAEDE